MRKTVGKPDAMRDTADGSVVGLLKKPSRETALVRRLGYVIPPKRESKLSACGSPAEEGFWISAFAGMTKRLFQQPQQCPVKLPAAWHKTLSVSRLQQKATVFEFGLLTVTDHLDLAEKGRRRMTNTRLGVRWVMARSGPRFRRLAPGTVCRIRRA